MPGITAEFPAKLRPLFQPKRFKIIYGGRDSAKSWSVARALIVMAAEKPLRIICGREFQNSMKDSVYQLLVNQIARLGYSSFYTILKDEIRGRNGSLFTFTGLHHNIDSLKSAEGTDILWIEEGHNVSKTSWNKLIPTIRKKGSEIWVTFNPELESDETYKRFIMFDDPEAMVIKMNWRDNPWRSEALDNDRRTKQEIDPDGYLHVYEGHTRQTLEGAIFAKEMRQAKLDGRITRVAYDPIKPVHTFWDMGWSDHTSIWFAQSIGFEYRIINFKQARAQKISEDIQMMQSLGYVYGTDFLPHDADAETKAANGRTIAQIMRGLGRTVKVVPRVANKITSLNAAREVFPRCWFDEANCADGLDALRRYRYEVDPDTKQFSKTPLHDEYSDGADAFQCLAMSLNETVKKKATQPMQKQRISTGAQGWMGH